MLFAALIAGLGAGGIKFCDGKPRGRRRKKPGRSPVSGVMGEAIVTSGSSEQKTGWMPGIDANPRRRPSAQLSPSGSGDKGAVAYGKDRSRAMSGQYREPYSSLRSVANGAPADLRELILASVLRSSSEPRPRISRRKPRFRHKASSRPISAGRRDFTEETCAEDQACRPRCLVPWAKPNGSAAQSGCNCRRKRYRQAIKDRGRFLGVAWPCLPPASAQCDLIAILMVGV
jgi:hypothetical protein